jgi:hypothetical protein
VHAIHLVGAGDGVADAPVRLGERGGAEVFAVGGFEAEAKASHREESVRTFTDSASMGRLGGVSPQRLRNLVLRKMIT